jgi:hypothetical protein
MRIVYVYELGQSHMKTDRQADRHVCSLCPLKYNLWKLAALIRSISDTHEGTMIFWGYVVHSDSPIAEHTTVIFIIIMSALWLEHT